MRAIISSRAASTDFVFCLRYNSLLIIIKFRNKKGKHDAFAGNDPLFHKWHEMRHLGPSADEVRRQKTAEYGVPNYFWLVVPWSLSIALEEVPKHMGVICVPGFEVVRKAPKIHALKVNAGFYRRLLIKAEARILNLKQLTDSQNQSHEPQTD